LRILFDNKLLDKHEVCTIREMGWSPQLGNGQLLKACDEHSFDVLLTADQNIPYQQNLARRKLALVVLGSNTWEIVRRYRDALAAALDQAKPGSCQIIPMTAKGRRRPKLP
jgi:hypothetical protein